MQPFGSVRFIIYETYQQSCIQLNEQARFKFQPCVGEKISVLLFAKFSMRTLCRSRSKRKGLVGIEPGSESVNVSSQMVGSIFVKKAQTPITIQLFCFQLLHLQCGVHSVGLPNTPSAALSRYSTAFVVGDVTKCNQLTGQTFKRKCDAQTEQNLINLQLPTSDKRPIFETHGQCRDWMILLCWRFGWASREHTFDATKVQMDVANLPYWSSFQY